MGVFYFQDLIFNIEFFMATIFSHAIAAGTLYKLSTFSKRKILFFCLLGSLIPDFDVIGFKLGIQYGDMLGHRGFSHSIIFAIIYALAVIFLFFRKDFSINKGKLFMLFFISIMSHNLLDMLTNGGLGVGLFIPFTSERYFFPYTPIEVSPIGKNFFSGRGMAVLLNELYLVILPCLALIICKMLILRNKKREN